jgi:hypothetical protein
MKIKLGGTRIVLIFKNVVVKIPLPLTFKNLIIGIASNYNEAIKWKTADEHTKKLLCPVHFHFCGLILIQKRLEMLNESEFDQLSCSIPFGITGVEEKEITFNNAGYDYSDKCVKLIDYGMTLPAHFRGKLYEKYKDLRNIINQ